jgi:hypothetical protein
LKGLRLNSGRIAIVGVDIEVSGTKPAKKEKLLQRLKTISRDD